MSNLTLNDTLEPFSNAADAFERDASDVVVTETQRTMRLAFNEAYAELLLGSEQSWLDFQQIFRRCRTRFDVCISGVSTIPLISLGSYLTRYSHHLDAFQAGGLSHLKNTILANLAESIE